MEIWVTFVHNQLDGWQPLLSTRSADVVQAAEHHRHVASTKFLGPEPRSAGGTVFLLLYGDQRWLCTLSRDNWRSICSTSDVLANRRNIHHRPALWWRFRDSGVGYKTAHLLTYQILLHSNRGTCVWKTCPESVYDSGMIRSWTSSLSVISPVS